MFGCRASSVARARNGALRDINPRPVRVASVRMANPDPDKTTTPPRKSGKAWWALAALMAVAFAIDLADGQPLKLLTSGLLLAGCLLSAALPLPRPPAALLAIGGCFAGALVVIVIRLATGTL
jgi:hypothetical protein